MMHTYTTGQGKVIYTLSLADLEDAITQGERLRAFCPVHGGDHQRSLSIDTTSGFGFCHCCHATVKIEGIDAGDKSCREGGWRLSHTGVVHPSAPHHSPRADYAPSRSAHWQQEEIAALTSLTSELCAGLASSRRARAYLDERSIPFALAEASSIGYLSRSAWEHTALPAEQRTLLTRWIGRLIFPLHSPDGPGFIGRTLLKWEPGMNENVHKALLDRPRAPHRWIKTCPAGWFGFAEPTRLLEQVILVEGGFDRLALLAAGIPASMVVALVGTSARPSWFMRSAPQLRRILLALDADSGGLSATTRLVRLFHDARLDVAQYSPPPDAWGKDWSERFRQLGSQCVWPLYEILGKDAESIPERRGEQ